MTEGEVVVPVESAPGARVGRASKDIGVSSAFPTGHPHGTDIKRADIQGLRAVAILMVVGFHGGLGWIPGGYIGVDVFFVISGYLITDHLYRELAASGRIALGAFYARRARRLLPSAAVVIVATLALSAIVLPPLEIAGVARDGVAAALYFANYRFAAEATNYLAGGSTSPFLHYWSLGVEEQFYLVWPLLLLACSLPWLRAGRRPPHVRAAQGHGGSRRLAVFAGLALVGTASFTFSLWLMRTNRPWTFFSLPTRAWELAAGGLMALAAPELRRLPARVSTLLGWVGLAGIIWAAVAFHASTPFPGLAALVPVSGAMAVLTGGGVSTRFGPQLVLGRRPLPFLGGVSYTWYLWHWPALVLAPVVLGRVPSTSGRLVVMAASLALAIATSVFVERPIQLSSWLRARSSRTMAMAGLLGCCAVATALAVAMLPTVVVGTARAATEKLALGQAPLSRNPADAGEPSSASVGSGHQVSPAETAAAALTAEAHRAVLRSLAMKDVPTNLNPSLSTVASGNGMASPFWHGCFNGFTDSVVHPCNYGDVGSRTSIVRFGDSHALMWFPAYEKIALANHWHLVAQAKATCPPIDVHVFSPDLGQWYVQCDAWRAAVVARIRVLRAAVVVLGFSRQYGVVNDHVAVNGPAWMGGLIKMIRSIRASGASVVVMGDVPYPPEVVPNCLSANPTNLAACEIKKRLPRFNARGVTQERRVVVGAGAGYIDTEPWFCGATKCAVVIGNDVVYHDDNHLAAGFVSWLTPVIGADLRLLTPSRLWRG